MMASDLLAAGPSGAPNLMPALVPLLVLIAALDAYCLIDLARARSVRYAPKVVWATVILFVSAPIGGLIYLFFGRDRGPGQRGAEPMAGAREAPRPGQHDAAGDGNPSHAGARQLPAERQPMVTTSGLTRDYGGAGDSAGRRVGGFSRGMVQRLGLACALVGAPELLILDEPTSALDRAGRAEMLGLVAAMRGSRTVIFSSHILADVQRIADQVGILRDGRLLYQGATRDLIDIYLKPSWMVRIAGGTAPVAAARAGQRWAARAEQVGADTFRVDATSIEAGERGIPVVG